MARIFHYEEKIIEILKQDSCLAPIYFNPTTVFYGQVLQLLKKLTRSANDLVLKNFSQTSKRPLRIHFLS